MYPILPTFSTETDIAAKAVVDAKKDAEADINKIRWFFYGCIFTVPASIVVLSLKAEIPTERLLGKSPEYVTYYTTEYRRKTKALRTGYTLMGCMGGTAIAGCTLAVLLEESSWQHIYVRIFGDTRIGGF